MNTLTFVLLTINAHSHTSVCRIMTRIHFKDHYISSLNHTHTLKYYMVSFETNH